MLDVSARRQEHADLISAKPWGLFAYGDLVLLFLLLRCTEKTLFLGIHGGGSTDLISSKPWGRFASGDLVVLLLRCTEK
jgi:hypothetical protein